MTLRKLIYSQIRQAMLEMLNGNLLKLEHFIRKKEMLPVFSALGWDLSEKR